MPREPLVDGNSNTRDKKEPFFQHLLLGAGPLSSILVVVAKPLKQFLLIHEENIISMTFSVLGLSAVNISNVDFAFVLWGPFLTEEDQGYWHRGDSASWELGPA